MVDFLCSLIGTLPLDCLQLNFMQRALLALLLLAPMTASLGVEIIQFRMSFFSDAIGHSAFAGAGLGILFAVSPHISMPVFGVLVGLTVIALTKRSQLSSDVAIGVIFSAVVAFGLAVISQSPSVSRDIQQFLFGDVLTVSNADILFLLCMLPLIGIFQVVSFNALFIESLNPMAARVSGRSCIFWQYTFAAILALVVIFAVWTVGVMLVTALLVVPAAAARNMAHSIRGMFWWAIVINIVSSFAGLILSAQPWLGTASGATVILCAVCCFLLSLLPGVLRKGRNS